MTKREKTLSILVLLQTFAILLLIGTIVWLRFTLKDNLGNNLPNYLSPQKSEEVTVDKKDLPFNVSASLVWWDQDVGLESIETNSEYIYSISPFWYELSKSGEIEKFSGAEDEDVINTLNDANIKVIPTISNEFEAEPLASIIADESKRTAHADEIYDLVMENDYDGISLNYENLDEKDKDNFTTFVTELAGLLHNDEKLISVHLHAKDKEPGTWNGPMSQDWEALGKVCDKLKIMAYDYHWSTSEPGAIAPQDWVEDVISHGLELIPKEKIYLGIPLYGYDWTDITASSALGEGVTYKQAADLAELNKAQIEEDSVTKSSHFRYTDSLDKMHEVWFENAESTNEKIKLVEEYELGGIDFWRLGGEDEGVWENLE
jgi:spore germination protein